MPVAGTHTGLAVGLGALVRSPHLAQVGPETHLTHLPPLDLKIKLQNPVTLYVTYHFLD